MLDIDQESVSGGTLFYDNAGGPLVGSDILFDRIEGVGTPVNDGEILTGTMVFEFTTGNINTILNPAPGVTIYVWDGPGSFTISGSVFDSGSNLVASGVLVSGTFTAATLTAAGSGQMGFVGLGIDSKNEDLAGFFGLGPTDWTFGSTVITTSAFVSHGQGGLIASVTEADFTNTKVVPEPGTIGLLGAGLAMLGLAMRRRRADRLAA